MFLNNQVIKQNIYNILFYFINIKLTTHKKKKSKLIKLLLVPKSNNL